MNQVFTSGSKHDQNFSRRILIKIENGCIAFYFYEQYKKHEEWVAAESERRMEYGEEDLTEDEKRNSEFYWIGIDDWVSDRTNRLDRDDNWHKHMREKNWFTKEMEDFINEQTK